MLIFLDKYHVIKPAPDNEEDTAKNKTEFSSLGMSKREWEIKVRQTWLKSSFSHSQARWPLLSHMPLDPFFPPSHSEGDRAKEPLNPSRTRFVRVSHTLDHKSSEPKVVHYEEVKIWVEIRGDSVCQNLGQHLRERKPFQIGRRHITLNLLLSTKSYGREESEPPTLH